jgi:hypothetical protein
VHRHGHRPDAADQVNYYGAVLMQTLMVNM